MRAFLFCVDLGLALELLQSYSFTPEISDEVVFTGTRDPVILSGRSTTECSNSGFSENVSNVAIAITDKGQGCYASSQYSVGDFPVIVGQVNVDGQAVAAYEIRPAGSDAAQFVASGSRLYLRLPGDSAEYSVYNLRGGALVWVATMQALGTAQFVSTSISIEALSAPEIYTVLPSTTSIPSPTRLLLSGHKATECDSLFPESESLGDVMVVTMSGGGRCWTDLRYSNSNFLVQKGHVGEGASQLVTYQISPPTTIATDFVASRSHLYIRKPTADVKLWTFRAEQFELLDTVQPSASTFEKTAVRLDNLQEKLLVIIRPAGEHLTVWPRLAPTVEAAVLEGVSQQWSLSCYRFQVDGQPFVPELHWNSGPGSHAGNYGTYKRFFPVMHSDGREGVIWQDFSNELVKVTWLSSDLLSTETTQLVALNSQLLVGAVGDDHGELLVLLGSSETPSSKSGTVEAVVMKFSSTGTELLRKSLPTDKANMNVYSFFKSGATLAWDRGAGTIAMAIARTMTTASDGLNHQGGIAIVLNASTLEMITNYGQTSGHSFGNSLKVSKKEGWYLGMDLGDNYPRGVNVWELRGDYRLWKKKLVYTFKTKHGTVPESPAGTSYPIYEEISGDQTFYQWSNDNYVYTELAHPGLHEVNDALLVFFATESPPLDNSLVGKVMNVPRNVAWVKIFRDLSNSSVLSPGQEERGGFYTFGGRWSEQVNRGISFLTTYQDLSQSVSRLKTAVLNDKIVLLWEVWSGSSYNRTEFMVIDMDGQVIRPVTTLAFNFQLPFADDVMVKDGKIVAYVGTDASKSGGNPSVARYEVCVGNCEMPSGTSGNIDSGSSGSSGSTGSGDTSSTAAMPEMTSSGAVSAMLAAQIFIWAAFV